MPLPKPPKTWVLVADSARGLLFELKPSGGTPCLEFVDKIAMPHDKATEPSDKPGRFPDPSVGQRSAVGELDHGQREREAHARILAERLLADRRGARFERLVVVAPPPVMGLLRSAWAPEVAQCVAAEVTEDLTRHPVAKIEAHLASVLSR
jgi:protein required for attachment to host cells